MGCEIWDAHGMHTGCIWDAHGMAKRRANGGQKGGQAEDCFDTTCTTNPRGSSSGLNPISFHLLDEAKRRHGHLEENGRNGGRDGKRSEGGGAHMDTSQISIKYSWAPDLDTHVQI